MISLGGLQLSDNLRLLGLRVAPVAVNTQRSEGGVLHVVSAPVVGGRALELTGYFTSAQVDAVMAMCDGQARELVHPRGNFSVIIVSCDLADWIGYVEPDPADFEEGKIILLEV